MQLKKPANDFSLWERCWLFERDQVSRTCTSVYIPVKYFRLFGYLLTSLKMRSAASATLGSTGFLPIPQKPPAFLLAKTSWPTASPLTASVSVPIFWDVAVSLLAFATTTIWRSATCPWSLTISASRGLTACSIRAWAWASSSLPITRVLTASTFLLAAATSFFTSATCLVTLVFAAAASLRTLAVCVSKINRYTESGELNSSSSSFVILNNTGPVRAVFCAATLAFRPAEVGLTSVNTIPASSVETPFTFPQLRKAMEIMVGSCSFTTTSPVVIPAILQVVAGVVVCLAFGSAAEAWDASPMPRRKIMTGRMFAFLLKSRKIAMTPTTSIIPCTAQRATLVLASRSLSLAIFFISTTTFFVVSVLVVARCHALSASMPALLVQSWTPPTLPTSSSSWSCMEMAAAGLAASVSSVVATGAVLTTTPRGRIVWALLNVAVMATRQNTRAASMCFMMVFLLSNGAACAPPVDTGAPHGAQN